MKYKNNFFGRIPNSTIFASLVTVFFLKILIYIFIKNELFVISLGGGSDAEYYHSYAKGYINIAVNIWPIILRYLNDLNLYSRNAISYFFLVANLFAIPILVAKNAKINFNENQKYYLYIVLLCLIYPTLYFFTFDIYRDVFMVLTFLISCLIVKSTLNSSSFLKYFVLLSFCVLMGVFQIALRPYLGVAFLGGLLLYKVNFTKKKLILLGSLYILTLWIASYIGIFDSITEYRTGFEEAEGGSNLGLDFTNPVMFIPNFILSFLGQMFGLYITNLLAIILLLIETVPFVFMLFYVFKNIKLADNFVRFLIIFFVLYASVWLIGNDNLGTAVRLRVYNYLAIYISFFYILRQKNLIARRLKVENL